MDDVDMIMVHNAQRDAERSRFVATMPGPAAFFLEAEADRYKALALLQHADQAGTPAEAHDWAQLAAEAIVAAAPRWAEAKRLYARFKQLDPHPCSMAVALAEDMQRLYDETRQMPPPSPPMVVDPKLFEELVAANWLTPEGNWRMP